MGVRDLIRGARGACEQLALMRQDSDGARAQTRQRAACDGNAERAAQQHTRLATRLRGVRVNKSCVWCLMQVQRECVGEL